MKIEQQRGISVTSSVMTFEKDGVTFNLLDTPGHEDFSRGHLPHADRGRFRGHGDRRGARHRGADAQAVRGLPPALRADHHLRQQGRPRGPRRRSSCSTRSPTCSQLDVCADELAGRHGRRVRGRVRSLRQHACSRREGDSREFLGKAMPFAGHRRSEARRDAVGRRASRDCARRPSWRRAAMRRSTPRPIARAT